VKAIGLIHFAVTEFIGQS